MTISTSTVGTSTVGTSTAGTSTAGTSTVGTSTAGPVTTRPKRSDVRSRILESAATAFLTRGYAGTAVSDVAAEAGFTKGAVYSNFGGKPELFCAVFAERFASLTGTAIAESELMTTQESDEGAAARIAASLAEQVIGDNSWPILFDEFRLLASRDTAIRDTYIQLRNRQLSELATRLRSRRQPLGLPVDFDFPTAANLLLTAINALALEHAVAPEAMPMELVETSLALLLDGLLA